MLQQVQIVLEEEKLLDILQDQTGIFKGDNQVCNFSPQYWKHLSILRGRKMGKKLVEAL